MGLRAFSAATALLCTGSLVAVSPSAYAAGETCGGEAATIVGTVDQETLNGTPGPDVIYAGAGNDLIIGGEGADLICASDGNDTIIGGDGADVAIWSPGDDNDIFEGQNGNDRLAMNLSAGSENVQVIPNGGRVLVTRDLGNVTLDLDGVESVDLRALGGTDNITTSADLGATDLTKVAARLEGLGGAGDSANDTVTVNGTASSEPVEVASSAAATTITTHDVTTSVTGVEAGNDTLAFVSGGGTDEAVLVGTSGANTLSIVTGAQTRLVGFRPVVVSGVANLAVRGEAGNDTIVGSAGQENLAGGGGSDLILGGGGTDTVKGGDGDDVLVGGPGDDTIVGGNGLDTASYANAGVPIVADLTATTATGDGNDTLTFIEVLVGSDRGDTLSGTASADRLVGGPGTDILRGRSGADSLSGGTGDDGLFGGPDTDVCGGGSGTDTAATCEQVSGIP